MKFGMLSEKEIVEASGGMLDGLFNIWHRDADTKAGRRLSIRLGNRRDSSSPMRGGILTSAAIEMRGSDTGLIIWYDPLELYYDSRVAETGYSTEIIDEMTEMLRTDRDPGPEYDPVANPEKLDYVNIAAQVGRWLLKIRGYKKLSNENRQYYELESFFNLECGIPALYSVFNEAGIDYSPLEQKRLSEVYEGLANMEEPRKRVDRALNAVRVSNILEFSPESDRKSALEELVGARFGRIAEAVKNIDSLKRRYKPAEADGLSAFMKQLVLEYRLPGSWFSTDETTGIF